MVEEENQERGFKVISVPTDRNLVDMVRESWRHTPLAKRTLPFLLSLGCGYVSTIELMCMSNFKKDLAEITVKYKTDQVSLERARDLIFQAQHYDYLAYGAGILTAAGFLFMCYDTYKTLRHPRDSDFFG